MTPDSRIGWVPFAVRAGLGAIRRRRPGVLYSTSPFASAHVAALLLHLWTRIPWVADFRDPWRDNPFRRRGHRSLEWLDEKLERIVLQSASHVVFNTSTAAEAACRRIHGLRSKCSIILNGFDVDVLRNIKAVRLGDPRDFVVAYVGEFYGRRRPEPVLEAIRLLGHGQPERTSRIRLLLVGPDRVEGVPLIDIVERYGLSSRVLVCGRKSHGESLSLIAGSDACLLIGAAGPGADLQIPNKLFEYIGLGKPILMAADRSNPALQLTHNRGLTVESCLPDDAAGIAQALARLVRRVETTAPASNIKSAESLDRRHRAAELLDIFWTLQRRTRTNKCGRMRSPQIVRLPPYCDAVPIA